LRAARVGALGFFAVARPGLHLGHRLVEAEIAQNLPIEIDLGAEPDEIILGPGDHGALVGLERIGAFLLAGAQLGGQRRLELAGLLLLLLGRTWALADRLADLRRLAQLLGLARGDDGGVDLAPLRRKLLQRGGARRRATDGDGGRGGRERLGLPPWTRGGKCAKSYAAARAAGGCAARRRGA
jgi:hypothetical protein